MTDRADGKKGSPGRAIVLFAGALAALAIAANLVFSGTVIKGQLDEHASLMDRAGKARERLMRPMTGEVIKKAVAGVDKFNRMLPGQGGLTKVINDIFRVADSNGLTIPTGDYSPKTVREAGISKYTISFPVEGTYKKIKRFIYDMEVLGHILAVEEIAFSSSKGGGKIGLNIRISTYFR